jgi:hypothetical protein
MRYAAPTIAPEMSLMSFNRALCVICGTCVQKEVTGMF